MGKLLTGFVLCSALSAILLVPLGCASQRPTQSGFISDYSSLQSEGPKQQLGGAKIRAARPSEAILSPYTAVFVEPSEVTAADLTAEQRSAISADLNQALRTKLGQRWQLNLAPGPGILRVRTAVTSVTKAKVALNVATSMIAAPLFNGGASGEAEIVDSVSGARIAALTWADQRRISDPLGFYNPIKHARGLMPKFADEIASLVSAGPPASDQRADNREMARSR